MSERRKRQRRHKQQQYSTFSPPQRLQVGRLGNKQKVEITNLLEDVVQKSIVSVQAEVSKGLERLSTLIEAAIAKGKTYAS